MAIQPGESWVQVILLRACLLGECHLPGALLTPVQQNCAQPSSCTHASLIARLRGMTWLGIQIGIQSSAQACGATFWQPAHGAVLHGLQEIGFPSNTGSLQLTYERSPAGRLAAGFRRLA